MSAPASEGLPGVEEAIEPDPPKTSRARVALRAVLGLCIGLATAALVAYYSDVKRDEVARSFAGIPPWAILACVASGFVMLAAQSLRWHTVMKPLLGLRYSQAYRAQLVGYMANMLLWGRAGDLLRVQYLGRRTGKSRATILGTEVVDRWLDFWGWIPTMFVLAAVADVPSWVWKAVAIFGGLLVSWGITMLVLARRGFTPKPGSTLATVYASFRTGVVAFATRRTLAIAFGLAPLSWLWEAFFIFAITPAFGIHVSFAHAFCVLVGFNLAMVVPSPGAIGTEEAGGVKAFMFFGVDASRALAFMIVYHLAQMIPGIIGGVVVLVAEGEPLFGRRRL